MLKNQTVVGAIASVLCCAVPAFVGRCVGLEQERRLTEKEKKSSAGNSLWQVRSPPPVSPPLLLRIPVLSFWGCFARSCVCLSGCMPTFS